ncbi:MAG: DUF2497 domain-containing protein [Parvularcula sp.]|jgi:cell pole-organizing protein PopZ|nr:DUF2497 domain-containing protein [Parvularcula sp.]
MAAAQSELSMDEILASIRRIIHEEEAPARPANKLTRDDNTVSLAKPERKEAAPKPAEAPAKAAATPKPAPAAEPEEAPAPNAAAAKDTASPAAKSDNGAEAASAAPGVKAEPEESQMSQAAEQAPEIKTAKVVSKETPAPKDDSPSVEADTEAEQAQTSKPTAATTAADEADQMTDRIVKTIMDNAQAASVSASFASLKKQVGVTTTPGLTLESMVQEMLRPMLKAWLDENLPGLVEKKVDEEIKKLTSG